MRTNTAILGLVFAIVTIHAVGIGLSADSRDDAVFNRSEFNASDNYENGSASQEVAEGVEAFVAEWLTSVSRWSYDHPGLARTVLLSLPVLLIAAVLLRYGLLGILVLYVAIDEYRATGRRLSEDLRQVMEKYGE